MSEERIIMNLALDIYSLMILIAGFLFLNQTSC